MENNSEKTKTPPGQFLVGIGKNVTIQGHYCIVIGDNLNVRGVFQVATAPDVTLERTNPTNLRIGIQYMKQYLDEINTRPGYPKQFVTEGSNALKRGISLFTEKLESMNEAVNPTPEETVDKINFSTNIIVMGNESSATAPFAVVIGDRLHENRVMGVQTGIPVTLSDLSPEAIGVVSLRIHELDTLSGFPPEYVAKVRPLLCWILDVTGKGAYSLLTGKSSG